MPRRRTPALAPLALALTLLLAPASASAGYDRTFEAGSLIIPMDLAYQDTGMLQAYGLVFQLLRQGVTVYWVIDPDKTWHDAPCDTAGDECAWDCAEEGTGIKCDYPTASPDFFVGATVVYDSDGTREAGATIASHGYRGGPFVIAAADAAAAMAVIDAWNDPASTETWSTRSEFHVVSVHEAAAAFDGYVRREMVAAPTIAVFSDGNEDIATGYLRAAGIRQSNGLEFPADKCGDGDCGPGTDNPDMLTVVSIMGDMGTCDAPNLDHRNGALFTEDGVPNFCNIMSMHWNVNDRETVECDGGGCPATQEECAGETFTYHGHEVVAEVRQFLTFPTHFFAECQAVNAYENTVPNPAWPFLDDEGRRGHFLTTEGTPPDCPCEGDFSCLEGWCDGRDCCQPNDVKERGAGFLIADSPNEGEIQILNPAVPYNQLDGAWGTTGGSEPAYNLSDYLGTRYIDDRDVTFVTGPDGPGDQDVWMTGFIDGACDITTYDEFERPSGECATGKVSYLGGHRYSTDTPMSGSRGSQGARVFLNALFEADCVTPEGQPSLSLAWSGARSIGTDALPADEPLTVTVSNAGMAAALDAELVVTLPAGVTVTDAGDATEAAGTLTWALGSIGPMGSASAAPARTFTARFAAEGTYDFDAEVRYRVGATPRTVGPASHRVAVGADRDGDGVLDADDPAPDDPNRCGDSDSDGCDDCTSGRFDPAMDGCEGRDAGPGGGIDAGTGGGEDGGCGCRTAGRGRGPAAPSLALLILGLALRIRARR